MPNECSAVLCPCATGGSVTKHPVLSGTGIKLTPAGPGAGRPGHWAQTWALGSDSAFPPVTSGKPPERRHPGSSSGGGDPQVPVLGQGWTGNPIPRSERGQQPRGPLHPSAPGTTVLQDAGGVSHGVLLYVGMQLMDLFCHINNPQSTRMRIWNIHKCCQIGQVETNKQMGILSLFYLFILFYLFFMQKKWFHYGSNKFLFHWKNHHLLLQPFTMTN